jgi:type II secretory pathway predicted ATPase ExeA
MATLGHLQREIARQRAFTGLRFAGEHDETASWNPFGDQPLDDIVWFRQEIAERRKLHAITGAIPEVRRGRLTWALTGSIGAGRSRTFRRNGQAMTLTNAGDEIVLLDQSNAERDRFSYAASSEALIIQTQHRSISHQRHAFLRQQNRSRAPVNWGCRRPWVGAAIIQRKRTPDG